MRAIRVNQMLRSRKMGLRPFFLLDVSAIRHPQL
jgi:hypothetical protein